MNAFSPVKRATLHLRLEPDVDAMLDRVSAERGKSRTEIARIAVRRYLEECDPAFRAELERQIAIPPSLSDEDKDWLDGNLDDLLQTLDEEDGGYDWGPDGPPR